jgi:uncharacterized RDD family membrane protein YckC
MPSPLSPTAASPRPSDSPNAPPIVRVERGDQEASGAVLRNAGFWLRLCALFLDGLLLLALSFGLGPVVVSRLAHIPKEYSAGISMLVACWLYFALLESGATRATFGKRAFKLEVATQKGQERIGFGRATARYFARFLSMLIACIGYLMQPFTPRKQALHDLLCGTVVLARGTPSRSLVAVVTVLLFVGSVPGMGIVLLVGSGIWWPAERETLRLLEEKQAIGTQGDRIRQGISFAEFESIAQERGLKWRWDPNQPTWVLFKVSSPICTARAQFRDSELYRVSWGCMN